MILTCKVLSSFIFNNSPYKLLWPYLIPKLFFKNLSDSIFEVGLIILAKTKKVWLRDCLIAATCKIYGAAFVTYDKKDYPMKDIKILTL